MGGKLKRKGKKTKTDRKTFVEQNFDKVLRVHRRNISHINHISQSWDPNAGH